MRLVALFLLFFSNPCYALVGAIDTDNKFPYVVRLNVTWRDGSTSGCSGVVSTSSLVSTAAHCIYNSKRGRADYVTIFFTDPDGIDRTSVARQFIIPPAYEIADRLENSARGSPAHSLRFHEMSMVDIAFVVPETIVQTSGYMHWGTQLLVAPYSKIGTTSATLPRSRVETLMTEELGDDIEAMVVGFGNYLCNDYPNRDGCISDDRRRFANVKIIPLVEVSGQVFSAPWLWCTGVGDQNVAPVQAGDSGGPLFVRHKSGRWFFMGYHSGGTYLRNCSSSLLSNIDTFWKAQQEVSDLEKSFSWKGSWNADKSIVRAFLIEMYESWSRPNEQAEIGLKEFYSDYDVRFYGETVSFDALVEKKRAFMRKWPQRRYEVLPSSIDVDCNDMWACEARAKVKWSVANGATGKTKSGTSDFRYGILLHKGEQAINPRAPYITSEQEGAAPNASVTGWFAASQRYCELFRAYELRDVDLATASNSNLIQIDAAGIGWNYSVAGCQFVGGGPADLKRKVQCSFKTDDPATGYVDMRVSGKRLSIDFDVPGFAFAGKQNFVRCD